MTDVIIVHSSVGNAHNHWYEWLGHNLTLEGYEVTLFNLEADTPANLDMWVTQMQHQINVRKKDTYFVTHGFGTIASLKFIESLNQNIEGLFSIAGFRDDAQDIDENIDLQDVTIDYDTVKNKVDYFYGLCSKSDKHVSYKETKRLMDTLEGHIRVVEEGGHFMEEDGFTTFTALQDRMQGLMTQ
ncbi:serine hydrolase [Staphylococcus pasteuri]|uniref:Serine hydrolase family protein n=2 Tax=Staphylococcus TaxID=1279 RepID=A0ABY1H348_9STAP|nr:MULTISPECIES: alpha/beta hydrolase [Staphylococcus]ATH62340.1 alpha/beta hydrolase [Staphylococcus pasteuri]KKI57709.1 hypothetical protein UF70_1352 [Staphylococcus pasteuri]MCF7599456.1 alpha/beta hydrolase [Staphylococcus pasteuri]MDI3233269.1 alpha/beta hydrolase [Staphylococcus pasteuri]MDO6574554.1 alpha/beta hydrolase [Staphylococcus pasteuri_A]